MTSHDSILLTKVLAALRLRKSFANAVMLLMRKTLAEYVMLPHAEVVRKECYAPKQNKVMPALTDYFLYR